jgi:hypothetical protein
MPSSGMLCRMALARTEVSEKRIASETSVLTRATRRNLPENGIPHSHRRENLKYYIALISWFCSGDVMFSVRYELGFYIP